MSVERIRAQLGVSLEMLNVSAWPSIPVEAVPADKRDALLRRLKACELYCAGELGSRTVAQRIGYSARL
jgi:hypothetical protein